MKKNTLIALLTIISFSLSAQKVGLVLSGGGAKGLYHVGIIKALEENNIPIDYVSGASMGAIVGAMYAAGYSPDEMIEFFVTDSVKTWLSGKIPDEYRYYFKRFEPTPEMVAIRINPDTIKKAIFQLPTNLISPYRIDLAFMNMISGASFAAGENFDSLMVPFRCVASDVYNKKLITFDKGSLPFAVRASMTIPLAFKPLVRDSILLYDGGMYDNFPWQVLDSAFKPDIYIGGVCASNYPNPSPDDIVGQISVMITDQTDYSLPDSSDIRIARRLKDISVFDYDRAPYIMALGYEDAMKIMPKILETIKRRVPTEEIEQKRKAFKSKIKPLIFEQIDIEGLNPKQTAYVLRQLGLSPRQLFNSEYFEEKYMRVLATEVFTGEFPEVSFNPETGYYRLKIRMATRPSMKVSLGGNVSSTSLNQLYLGFSYRTVGEVASMYGINGYLGTFYNSVQAGGRHDFYTQFPFYIDYTYGFEMVDRDTYNSTPYYKNQVWRYKTHTNNFLSTTIAVPVLKNAAFRGRLTLGVTDDNYFQGLHNSSDYSDHSRFTYASLSAEIQTHTLNYALYPNNGKNQFFSVKYITGLEKFTPGSILYPDQSAMKGKNRSWIEVQFNHEQYVPLSSWFTLGFMGDILFSSQPKFANPYITAMTAPEFAPTPNSKAIFMKEYTSSAYLGLGVMPTFKFIDDVFYLRTYAMAFLPHEIIFEGGWVVDNVWNRFNDYSKYIFGGTLVYQTVIGPASLTVEKYTTGPKNWSIVLNFGYTLFNNRRF